MNEPGKQALSGLFLGLLGLTLCLPVAAEPLPITGDRSYNLAGHLEQFRPDPDWIAGTGSLKGSTGDGRWYRFAVRNSDQAGNWYLTLNNSRLDHAEFFAPNKQGGFDRQLAGDHHPFEEWSEPYSHPVFRFFLQANETKTFYFYVRSTSNYVYRVEVLGPMTLARREQGEQVLHGLNLVVTLGYIGLIVWLFRRNENPNLLLLIPFSIVYYLFLFMLSGNSFQFWPGLPWLQDRLPSFVITSSMISLLLFFDGYLRLRKRARWMHRLLLGVALAGVPAYYQLIRITPVSRLWMVWHVALSLVVILAAALVVWRRSQQDMRYVFYFFSVFIAGSTIKILLFFEIIDVFQWYYNWPAMLYPVGIFILLRASLVGYRDIARRKEELENDYALLLKKLEPGSSSSRSRVRSLDKRAVLADISALIASEAIIEQELFTLDKMAGRLGIRTDQLSELLNKEMSMTFSEFINTIRIRKACHLMAAHPDRTITRIFLESGFQSKAPFNTAFRRIVGTSPTEYRQGLQT